jgi:hypothetical protein
MPRSRLCLQEIRAEIAWINKPVINMNTDHLIEIIIDIQDDHR